MKRANRGIWLLAVDGSADATRAARYVACVAGRQGAREVRVLTVQPVPKVRLHPARRRDLQLEADAAGARAMRAALSVLKAAGLRTRAQVSHGRDPAREITALARKARAAEIVLGTRGMSAAGNLALGSVAYKTLHLARQPVTLVPGAAEGRPVRLPAAKGPLAVLVAIDGSAHSARAATYVRRLHEADAALRVHLVNVQPRVISGNVRRFISQAEINRYLRLEGEAALRRARRLLERAGIRHEAHVRAGPPAATVAELARDLRCARIVMGTRGLGAFGGLLLGSVTYGVVHLADVPVTLVK